MAVRRARTRRAVDRSPQVAFSDGVFADRDDVLVLNMTVTIALRLDGQGRRGARQTLNDQWPELLSDVAELRRHRSATGSCTTGCSDSSVDADGALMALNLLLLAFIALIPWPTEMLGRYGDTTAAVGGVLGDEVCTGASSVLLGWTSFAPRCSTSPVTDDDLKASTVRSTMIASRVRVADPGGVSVAPDLREDTWCRLGMTPTMSIRRPPVRQRPRAVRDRRAGSLPTR